MRLMYTWTSWRSRLLPLLFPYSGCTITHCSSLPTMQPPFMLHHTITHTWAYIHEHTVVGAYKVAWNKTAPRCSHRRQCNHRRRSRKIEETACASLPLCTRVLCCSTHSRYVCTGVSYFITNIFRLRSSPTIWLSLRKPQQHTRDSHAWANKRTERSRDWCVCQCSAHRHGYSTCGKLRERRAENVVGACFYEFCV